MPSESDSYPRTILFFDHTAQMSGGEIALLYLVTHLDATRYRPVVGLFSDGPLREKLQTAGIETHLIPLDAGVVETRKESLGGRSLLKLGALFGSLAYCRRLARLIRQTRASVVHTNSLKSDILGGFAGRLARVPVVWHVRDRIEPDYLPAPVVRAFRLLAHWLPACVVANSAATLSTLHLPTSKLQAVVYSGLVMEVIGEATLQPNNPTPIIGLVGRISQWKGQHIFINAAAQVRQKYPTAQFQIIGAALFDEQEYEKELHALVERLGLTNSVTFLGHRPDVPELLQKMDILAHASISGEPFGQVVVQGMAAGRPVVATNGGGIPEIITDGMNGLLVPMNNVDALADALCRLLAAPLLRERLGEAGRQRVEERFTITHTVMNTQAIYDRLLK